VQEALVTLVLFTGLLILLSAYFWRRREQSWHREVGELEQRLEERTAELTAVSAQLQQEIAGRAQVEESLRRSERFFRALTENAADVISVVDSTRRIAYDTTSTRSFLGFAPGFFIGRHGTSLIHPEDRPLTQRIWEELQEPKAATTAEMRVQHRSGEWRWLEVRGRNLLHDPDVAGFVFNSRDITENKLALTAVHKSRESLSRLYAAEQQARLVSETLRAASVALSQSLDFETVLDTLLSFVRQLVPYDCATFWLQEGPGLAPRAVHKRDEAVRYLPGADGAPAAVLRIPSKEGNLSEVPQFPEDGYGTTYPQEQTHNWLAVSLAAGERSIGLLLLEKLKPERFSQEQRDLAHALAAHAAVALHNAQLFAQVNGQRDQLRRLALESVNAQEAERRRIARELHDEAGQALTALQFMLKGVRLDLGDDSQPLPEFLAVRRQLDQAIALVDQTMVQMRLLAHDLHPAALDDLGLNPTLKGFCRDFEKHTRLPVAYTGVDVADLPEGVGISLYRFLQEALTNVARHAQATCVTVSLENEGDAVRLSVTDNGRGFDAPQVLGRECAASGIGLRGMQERIEALGGMLQISSRPGAGVSVTAVVSTV
jgi:PAS domain S-box-containing protein